MVQAQVLSLKVETLKIYTRKKKKIYGALSDALFFFGQTDALSHDVYQTWIINSKCVWS